MLAYVIVKPIHATKDVNVRRCSPERLLGDLFKKNQVNKSRPNETKKRRNKSDSNYRNFSVEKCEP